MLLKWKKIFFHRSHDIENKLFIIIHADKINVRKKTNFSQTKLRVFSRALRFETHKSRRSPRDVPSLMIISPTQE